MCINAYGIKLAENKFNEIQNTDLYSFNDHNKYWHHLNPVHKYGHIIPKSRILTYRDREYILCDINEIVENSPPKRIDNVLVKLNNEFLNDTAWFVIKEFPDVDFQVVVETFEDHPPHN